MNQEKNKTTMIVMTAMIMGLIMLMTYLPKLPVPATQGYVHLGDCMIFFGVLLLGWKYGAVAAGFGSALADIMGGYFNYAPVTLAIKFLMAAICGLFIEWALKKNFGSVGFRIMEVIGMIIGGFIMVLGYYLAESLMYGNFVTPVAAIPMNILQFVVGVVIATALYYALEKTPMNKLFSYNIVR